MVHGAGQIRVCECNSPEWSAAQSFARGGLAILTKKEAGLRAEIGVSPAIQNDSSDVTLSVESRTCKHQRKLSANAAFVIAEGCAHHFAAAAMALVFGGVSRIGVQNLQR